MTYGPIETPEIERMLKERKESEMKKMKTILMEQVKEKRLITLKDQNLLSVTGFSEKPVSPRVEVVID
jgi:hypothetical protein